MKDSRTDLQKINDRQNYKYLSILVAVQVIAASIFYLLFFTWELIKEKRLEYQSNRLFQFFENWICIKQKQSIKLLGIISIQNRLFRLFLPLICILKPLSVC